MASKSKFVPHELRQDETNADESNHVNNVNTEDKKEKDVHVNNLPTFNVTSLPSNGLPYPNGYEISYRKYNYGEIKKFNSSKFSLYERYEFAMEGIFTSFPKGELTFADFLYLAILRRIDTIGNVIIPVEYVCNHCNELISFDWDSKTVEFETLEVPSLPMKVTFLDGREFKFTPLTYDGFFRLEKEGFISDSIAALVECSGIKVGDEKFQEKYDIFYGCNNEDGTLLDKVDRMMHHGLASLIHICTTEGCGKRNLVDVDRGDVLMSPFPESTIDVTNRINFGV